jgi:Spy/CpxP family protein refolding chaperone
VTIQVGGQELAGMRLDGQEVIAAQLLEEILQLQPKSISARLSRDGRFVEGRDYVVLRGRALDAVREHAVDFKSTASPQKVSNLTVLTEVGVAKVMCTMRSPVTDVLAAMLYGSNFMRRAARAVMQGDQEGFAQNAADDAMIDDIKGRLVQLQQLTQQQAQQIEELKADSAYHYRCTGELSERIEQAEQDMEGVVEAAKDASAEVVAQALRNFRAKRQAPRESPSSGPPLRPRNGSTSKWPHLPAWKVGRIIDKAIPAQSPYIARRVNAQARKAEDRYWQRKGYSGSNGRAVPGYTYHAPHPRYPETQKTYYYSPAFVDWLIRTLTDRQVYLWDDKESAK